MKSTAFQVKPRMGLHHLSFFIAKVPKNKACVPVASWLTANVPFLMVSKIFFTISWYLILYKILWMDEMLIFNNRNIENFVLYILDSILPSQISYFRLLRWLQFHLAIFSNTYKEVLQNDVSNIYDSCIFHGQGTISQDCVLYRNTLDNILAKLYRYVYLPSHYFHLLWCSTYPYDLHSLKLDIAFLTFGCWYFWSKKDFH